MCGPYKLFYCLNKLSEWICIFIENSESERDSLYERILFINKQNELEHVVCELESSN